MKLTLGFVGVGNIGEPVCRHLIVHDVNPEALTRLEDTTAEPAASAALLARRAGVAPENHTAIYAFLEELLGEHEG